MAAAFDTLPGKVVWARRGFWARFSPALETAFIRFHEKDLIQRARWSAAIAAAVMTGYALLDVFMITPEIMPLFLLVRGLMMILPLMLVWWMSYRPWGQRNLQRIGGGASVSSGLAVIIMLWIARTNDTPIAYEGLILTIFYFYCCGGLRLRWSVLAGTSAMVIYPFVAYSAGLSLSETITRAIFLVSTNIVGVVSAGLMELSARRNFAQRIQLEAMSRDDPLTGLLNRRALDSRLAALWDRAAQAGTALHVAMIDVDYFKAYNDHYGHAGGDQVLRYVADVLRRHKGGPDDLVVRYGGEEFLFIWPETADPADGAAQNVIGKASPDARLAAILHDVHDVAVPHAQSPLNRLGLSIGAITVRPTQAQPVHEASAKALRQADVLLYLAKTTGRNRAVTAESWHAAAPEAGAIPDHVAVNTITAE